jgi:pimeloyl-ACP methyl ester carboxylesterase
MNIIVVGAIILVGFFAAGLSAALVLVASAPPAMPKPVDVFDFASLASARAEIPLPSLRRFAARDGEELAYRYYDSDTDRILIFVHGSSYHGAGYHALASFISKSGAARVVLPNLRGHFQSGRRRGDVDYIGQLEDDMVDLITFLRGEQLSGPITLGGHSSGGGFVIRFAGGGHNFMSSYLMLAPIIPTSPTVKGGNAGGWANLHMRRLFGLLALNVVGIHGFDALPIVEFNKPAKYRDGTETLAYSYRLNTSYHPRYRYQNDLSALGDQTLMMIGAEDQAINAHTLFAVVAENAPRARTVILPQINHLGISSDPQSLDIIASWLRSLPPL